MIPDKEGAATSPEGTCSSVHDAALFYDAVSSEFEDEYYGANGDNAIQLDVARFRGLLDRVLLRGGVVLELGSGTGYWLRWLRECKGATAVGVDLSEEMCRKARARGSKYVVVADLSALPFREGAFDAVIAPYCALDHVEEYERAFREIARVSASLSRLVLMVDNADRMIRIYWRVAHKRVQSLGGDPRAAGMWRHRVDGVEVEVFTKMFKVRELRVLLPDFRVRFFGVGFVTPLMPRWARRKGSRSTLLMAVIRPVEALMSRCTPRLSALLVVYGHRRRALPDQAVTEPSE